MRGKDEADAPPPESLLDSVAAAAWCAWLFFSHQKNLGGKMVIYELDTGIWGNKRWLQNGTWKCGSMFR